MAVKRLFIELTNVYMSVPICIEQQTYELCFYHSAFMMIEFFNFGCSLSRTVSFISPLVSEA